MNDDIHLTVLLENSVQSRELKGEHGLAFHLATGAHSLLFDTGQSDLLVHNARLLGVDLTHLSAIALSHGHYDHTGGLPSVRKLAPDAPLYVHPAAFQGHFARDTDGRVRSVGIPSASLEAAPPLAAPSAGGLAPIEVWPGVFLTGEIPRETDFEDVGGPFFSDEAGTVPDPITDDQALFFDTREGLVVLLGCAHAGVVNTLRHIHRLTSGRPVHTLLGGMHLVAASPERMRRTVEALRELKLQRLGPGHCTGVAAAARLWSEFPGTCTPCAVGRRFLFQR